ncbi:MAG: response regulator [Candidatus Gastranaerophilales bacterium]|nr:response regulator [Candidatus Gastranaerophilales bacterium]
MSKTILVIDDSPFVYKTVVRALQGDEQYEVVGNALNGQLGIDLYIEKHPDIITLDVTMPVMDGLETARKLFELNPNVKIVMLSAMGDETLLNEAKELGIKHFLMKPFKPDTLIAKLAEVV